MGRIERILNKVDSFNETGRFEEAIKELKKAIDIAPEDPDVLLSFALTYDGMNDLESSMSYFHKAIEICPEDAYLWTQYGITLSRNNKHHHAIKIFQNALMLDPTYTISKWNLGLTYRSIGHFEDAVNEFTECLDIEPNSEYFTSFSVIAGVLIIISSVFVILIWDGPQRQSQNSESTLIFSQTMYFLIYPLAIATLIWVGSMNQ